MPGYLEKQGALKTLGIDQVIIFCVNDGMVMNAWAKDQGVPEQGLIKFLADPTAALTRALGMVIDHAGPQSVLGYPRSKRFAMYLEDGSIKIHRVSEKPEDPAGDDDPSLTVADAMISAITELSAKEL